MNGDERNEISIYSYFITTGGCMKEESRKDCSKDYSFAKKITAISVKVLFWIIFFVTLGILVLVVLDLIEAITAPSVTTPLGEVSKYPFGTEKGGQYCSRGSYVITGILQSYLYVLALCLSATFYWLKQKAFGTSILLFSIWLPYYAMSAGF